MKLDSVKQYEALRASLIQEKARLEARLAAISHALRGSAVTAPATPQAAVAKGGAVPGRKRAKNKMSLKEAVLTVLKAGQMTKPDIITAVKALGYKFTANSPMNSLNTLLYTPGTFKNHGNGKWSILKK